MKKHLLFLATLFFAFSLHAQKFNLASLDPSAYKTKTIIIKVKESFRANCNEQGVTIPVLQKTFNSIGVMAVQKKFKNEKPPREKFNAQGLAYADLSLIYEIEYSAAFTMEKVITALLASNVLVYAEPHFIPKTSYNPNDPQATTSGQYHIGRINAYNAWNVTKGDSNVIIGITDTGTDPLHPDLKDNIKHNYADPINGIDDDLDGYVDNFSGWDLGTNDNDPTWQGNAHGVHVCGIAGATTDNSVGIAGIGFQCKFLPVKIADASGALVAAYEGIKYAADHGCKVINCSWGGPAGGQYGQDIITYATINKDALVVIAAGNTGAEEEYFPAAYEYALAVGNLSDFADIINYSSTYGYFLDVSAPGTNVISTWSGSGYSSQTGTSMASPVVAGAAAIVRSFYSGYTALQAGERLKRTTDNIYNLPVNSGRKFKLGTGRINLFRAVNDPLTPSVVFNNAKAKDKNDSLFTTGDTLSISGLFTNYLAATAALNATLVPLSSGVTAISNINTIGVLNTLASTSNSTTPFTFALTGTMTTNAPLLFRLDLKDGSYSSTQFFTIYANVDYMNITINDVSSTTTSKGKIGYNQDAQVQGLGFLYNGTDMLYEAGLMIGTSDSTVSDCVRGSGTASDVDFKTLYPIERVMAGAQSDFDTYTQFDDATATKTIGVQVDQRNFAWNTTPNRKFIIWEYALKNTTADTLKNLFAGIFADWDIDAGTFANNKSAYDAVNKMGYSYCTNAGGKYAGIKLLTTTGSPQFYAIDNVSGGGGGVDISGGFTPQQKYTVLSTARNNGGGTGTGNDIINVMSSGPHTIAPNKSTVIAFALIAGDDLLDLQTSAVAAQVKYSGMVGVQNISTTGNDVLIYPNPASQQLNIKVSGNAQSALTVFDITGKIVYAGKISSDFSVNTSDWARGLYLVKLESEKGTSYTKIVLH